MARMNRRLEHGQRLYHCQAWSLVFAKAQWRYALHITNGAMTAWAHRISKFNVQPRLDPQSPHIPQRARGRPQIRWDDHIKNFCKHQLGMPAHMHWVDYLSSSDYQFEDMYAEFLTGAHV